MVKSMKQFEVLQWASLFLEENNCESMVGEILLRHHMQTSRSEFYMMMREQVPNQTIQHFKRDIQKHIETGIPVQHLTGYEFFYDRKFIVNKQTLIPRPETEELVYQVIKKASKRRGSRPPTIVDVGTGSGVIAITLALEIPQATVYGVDISQPALDVAKKNAQRLNANVHYMQGDFLQPIIDQQINVDMIVSNPPYIAKSEKQTLSRTVKDFDPSIALFAKDNGLAAYQKIMQQLVYLSESKKDVFLEIGFEQGLSVPSLIKQYYPQSLVNIIKDINELDRIVIATIN